MGKQITLDNTNTNRMSSIWYFPINFHGTLFLTKYITGLSSDGRQISHYDYEHTRENKNLQNNFNLKKASN